VGRSIFIGDVHGCARELSELLDELGPGADDQVVFVGDLVARGPDTPEVLRLARETRAVSVLGNHEHRIIVARQARLSGERGPRLGPSHQALLDELSEEDWEYLMSFPLSLEFADNNVIVVHAGIVPGVPLAEQQAWTLLHVRSITHKGEASDKYSSISWAALYDDGPHIVFGHNAQAGLQIHPAATGLDTGCVYGGSLTALVLKDGQEPPRVEERRDALVAIDARARYVDYGPRPKRELHET
jgi:hypothetical protein